MPHRDRDPLQERRAKRALAEDTFQSIAEAYFARERKNLRTAADRQRVLERFVYPQIGAQPINAIRRSEIRAAARSDRGRERLRAGRSDAGVYRQGHELAY
jgi:hypothetical protein